MAERRITVECDDSAVFTEFFQLFGGSGPVPGRLDVVSDIHLAIETKTHPSFGAFSLSGHSSSPIDAREFSFAVQLDQGPFDELTVREPNWTCFAFRGSSMPAFAFRGSEGVFALDSNWRGGLMLYLFWRLLRIRDDAIFFHSSAVGVCGGGTMFVGPSGAGKSTTALALASRGHEFLSDEVAGYLPSTGELIPFRRPVGVKPGPQPAAVTRGLPADVADRIARDGFYRLDIGDLFAVAPQRSLPLTRIVFLRGFAPAPLLEPIVPGRPEIAELQPLQSSFLNASHSRRVFELTRLLGRVRTYRLFPGQPDETASYLEEAFAQA